LQDDYDIEEGSRNLKNTLNTIKRFSGNAA